MVKDNLGSTTEWTLANPAVHVVKDLAAQLQISPILAQILAARNMVDPQTCRDFLNPIAQPLLDPLLLRDMDLAVDRIRRAIAGHERILAYGDYDVDGTCSLAILKRSLEILGGSVEIHVPHRLQEGYGLRQEVIEQAARAGTSLIITVDTGTRAHAVIEYACSRGIDVIVTDHHLPDATLPRALAVVNPNRTDCAYPNKHLCGAGVTLKLIDALFRHSAVGERRRQQILSSLLKPVSIATIADVVPLVGENRALVAQGLLGLRVIRNPGLAALFSVAGILPGTIPSCRQIAFQVAPRMNAAGRIDTARAVTDLLLTEDPGQADRLASQLTQWNANRQQLERSLVDEIVGSEEHGQPGAGYVFCLPTGHLGVVGIVASRLVERFRGPVIVLADDPKEAGVLAGSGRSIPGFHLLEALESMADLFVSFGGHSQAAGVRLRNDCLDEFRTRFAECASRSLVCKTVSCSIDVELELSDLTTEIANELQLLAPFGNGNPVPVLLVRNVQVAGPVQTLTPGKHFRVPMRQESRVLTCKAWNFADHIELIRSGRPVDMLVNIEENGYSARRGGAPWSATIRQVRPSCPD